MNFYTASNQLQSQFSNPHAGQQARASFFANPSVQRREISDAGAFEEEAEVLSRTLPTDQHAKARESIVVQFGELTQRLSDLEVSIVGLGGSGSEVVRRVAFGGVGRRLADVASQNYRIPRVIDANRRERKASAVALLREWLEVQDDPTEAREWEAFKRELDDDRPSARKLFP